LPHQIRRSNSYGLAAMLRRAGVRELALEHLPDETVSMTRQLEGVLADADLVVLSGGVSAGRRDHVPAVLNGLGVQTHFHRVRQRPGGPFWFGTHPDGPVVFALPGNPVSALTSCRRYVIPQVLRAMGAAPEAPEMVVLGEDIVFAPPLVYFPPVRREPDGEGGDWVVQVPYHGSGDLSSLAESTGFVELEEGQERFSNGARVAYYAWDH
jgi:molybdopterin molybdotransferase